MASVMSDLKKQLSTSTWHKTARLTGFPSVRQMVHLSDLGAPVFPFPLPAPHPGPLSRSPPYSLAHRILPLVSVRALAPHSVPILSLPLAPTLPMISPIVMSLPSSASAPAPLLALALALALVLSARFQGSRFQRGALGDVIPWASPAELVAQQAK